MTPSALTELIKAVLHATETPDLDDVIQRMILDFQHDSISLTSCGNLLYTMIYRCLNSVPIYVIRCFIIEVGMPVVPIDVLVQLLSLQVRTR